MRFFSFFFFFFLLFFLSGIILQKKKFKKLKGWMGLCMRRRWPASPDIGPLVNIVYSERTTSHIQKNERGVCV